MADITIADLSNGAITTVDNQYVWSGTGVFDVLMKAINGNIKVQYDNGNIDTSQYATVYLGAVQSAIQASMDFLLREKLIEAQIEDVEKGVAVKTEQIAASHADTLAKVRLAEEQIIAEAIKNGNITNIYTYTYTTPTGSTGTGSGDIEEVFDAGGTITGVVSTSTAESVSIYDADKLVKGNQAALIQRQREAYDDNLMVEEAKVRKDVIFGYALGGVGLADKTAEITDMYEVMDKINKITET